MQVTAARPPPSAASSGATTPRSDARNGSLSSAAQDAAARGHSTSRDSTLLRVIAQKNPLSAPHGTKGAVWEDVARTVNAATDSKFVGIVCRNRLTYLLDKYDRFRVGRAPASVITSLDKDTFPILDEMLQQVVKARDEAKVKAKDKNIKEDKAREEKNAAVERELLTKQKAAMKERDEKRAAAVVAAAARDKELRENAGVLNTATVVAKRRKRKGVKTQEQKRASAAMFDAILQSREEYINQLRVETAAQAAAKETEGTPGRTKKYKKSSKTAADTDLSVLRAVAKLSPFSQETKQAAEAQWAAVAKRVMEHCNLKFTPTAIRDRCDALIRDFEANDCKRLTFTSGVVVADEERLSLLRVIRKAHRRQHRASVDKAERQTEAREVEKDDSAIEIEDDQDDEQEGSTQAGDVAKPEDEQVEESQLDEEDDDEEVQLGQDDMMLDDEPEHDFTGAVSPASTVIVPALQQIPRKRRRTQSGTSPDADPAVGMEIEELTLNASNDSNESFDFTPRKYKQRRQGEGDNEGSDERIVEQRVERHQKPPGHVSPSDPLNAVVDVIVAERQERRAEFHAVLELMKQQLADHRSEWEREHMRRTREQNERQQEMTALIGMLADERKSRQLELATMTESMSKEREDRREEFKAMMALMGKMVETKSHV